jgi:addiction module RelB/DinJ family antitoxin
MVIMNSTVLNVKIDKTLKEQAQAVAKSLGLPISTIVAASLRDVVRTRSITFSAEPQLKQEVIDRLLESSAKAKAGIDISPTFDNTVDAFDWLDSDLDK